MVVEQLSEPFVQREKKKVAFIVTSEHFEVVDLEFDEAKARELYLKLGKALGEFNN